VIIIIILPEKVNTHYQLRPRQHDRQLIPKTTKLYSCNFVIRMLYKHSYWLYFIVHSLIVLITFIVLLSYIVQVAFWQLDIKRRWWWWWSNNMKLVHCPLIGGLLNLVQRTGLSGVAARPGPSSLYQMPIHQRSVYQSPYWCILVCCSAVLMCL